MEIAPKNANPRTAANFRATVLERMSKLSLSQAGLRRSRTLREAPPATFDSIWSEELQGKPLAADST
jgi:hypothetical protein